MHKDHMALKDFRTIEKQLQSRHVSEQENLELMKRKNQRMEQDVQRFKERKNLLEKAEELEKKRAWTVSCFLKTYWLSGIIRHPRG